MELNIWAQLGVAGAALFLLWQFINKLFIYLENRNKSDGTRENNKFDRLCDKIDNLIEAFHDVTQKIGEVILSNTKDQKDIVSRLNQHTNMLMDIQRRVVRIDDRTYKCLGEPKKESEVEE